MNGKRWVVAAAVLACIAAVGATVLWLRPSGAATPEPQSGGQAVVTTPVERGSLATSTRLSGKLSFGESQALPPTQGILTAVPTAGAQIGLGEAVYEVEGQPVVLMVGPRPFWRELSMGVSDGEDIRQLQQNLADLGYYYAYVGDTFDQYTEDALKRWQADRGLEKTGVFTPSDVVVVPVAPIRIDRITGSLGLSETSPATFTSPVRSVTAPLNDSQVKALEVGRPVKIQTGDGSTFPGEITQITEGKPAAGDQEAVKPAAIIAVEGADEATPGDVKVVITEETADDLLLVPVSSLLATSDDGYAVEVQRGGPAGELVRIPVEIGRVSSSKAEIISGELEEGDEVVVTR